MKSVTAYTCDFCPKSKLFKTKSSSSRHERNCYRNPETRSCASCGHFEMVERLSNSCEFGEEIERSHWRATCEAGLTLDTLEEGRQLRTKCDEWTPKTSAEGEQ